MANTKNYQKTSSRSSSKTTKTTSSISQSIKYLVMNPLAVNYNIKQEVQASGDNTTIYATQQDTN